MIQEKYKKKNIVITGGNSGIGYQSAKGLYLDGHNVIFGSRNKQNNQQAVKQIQKNIGGTIRCFKLDLSIKQSIQQFANYVKDNFNIIDILLNNAGILMQQKVINQLGIEMTLAINHFGHFYLTYLLFNKLKQSNEARIINVSSLLHYHASSDMLQDISCSTSFQSWHQYSNSKLMNVLFSVGLNNMFKQKNIDNIKTASLHPGTVYSNFGNNYYCLKSLKSLVCCFFKSNQTGAKTSLNLCRIPFQQIISGEYYDDDTKHKKMHSNGRNMKLVQQLWSISENAFQIKFN